MARGGCRQCGTQTTNPRLCKECQRLARQGFFAEAEPADSEPEEREYECTKCGETYRGTTSDDCPACGSPWCRYVGPLPGEDKEIIVTDGGTSWADLTGFQRDILEAIARLERDCEPCYGLAVKRRLEPQHGEVNHGRLYPNLDELVRTGFVEKGQLDKRTNEYTLTTSGRALLIQRAERLADAAQLRAVGGGQA